MSTEVVSCNLCGSEKSELLYILNDIIYEIPGEFKLRRCQYCGLIYLSPRPTEKTIGEFYPVEYSSYRPPIDHERFFLLRWIRRRKLIKRRQLIEKYSDRKHGRILDVGCATGLFLNEMSQAGWESFGVEPITVAAKLAREWFDLNVQEVLLRDSTFSQETFDVVTFWDVLEHTFSPVDELQYSANLLRPGGILAVNIPNWDSVERKLFKQHWQGLDSPRHLFVFTRDSLEEMLTQTGFYILGWICFMPGYFSFTLSLNRWLHANNKLATAKLVNSILTFPGVRFLFEPLFAFINWIGKGPVISVFACKKSATI